MSLQKSNRKDFVKDHFQSNESKYKGNYTEEGFYRRNNHHAAGNHAGLHIKTNSLEHRVSPNMVQSTSEMGYPTLNPTKYTVPSFYSGKQEQYELMIEFELKRQIEKNRILEERLKNKEVFISQMNSIQSQLTSAFQKCQEELEYYKKKSAQPSQEARQYLQEINELKHLVIRLQDKITQYEKRSNKKYSSAREQDLIVEKSRNSVSRFKQDSSGVRERVVKDKRSKTMFNQQESSPQFKKFDLFQEYMLKYPSRLSNFMNQFLSMVECFSEDAQIIKRKDKANVKKRLKIGWKWIKQVVIQWNNYKNYIQRVKYFHKRLRKLLNLPDTKNQLELMDLILSAISQ